MGLPLHHANAEAIDIEVFLEEFERGCNVCEIVTPPDEGLEHNPRMFNHLAEIDLPQSERNFRR